MRPCSASRGSHIALVELGGNGVVARYPTSHDLVDDGADVGCKSPCYVWIAEMLSPRGLATARASLVRFEICSRSRSHRIRHEYRSTRCLSSLGLVIRHRTGNRAGDLAHSLSYRQKSLNLSGLNSV